MTTAAEPTGGSPQVARGPGGGRRQGARPRQGRRPVRIAPGWTEGPGVPWSPVVCRSELAPVHPDSHASVVARPRRADAKAGLANGWSRVVAYVALTKPRIIELLLVTTLPTMLLAEGGFPPVSLMATTLVGGTAAAGVGCGASPRRCPGPGSCSARSTRRPLVTGEISPRAGLVFGLVLAVASVVWFAVLGNPLAN